MTEEPRDPYDGATVSGSIAGPPGLSAPRVTAPPLPPIAPVPYPF